MMKILTVVGARPQFVKAAVVSRALRALPHVREVLVHTGQHYDANLSDIFFEELDIPAPDFHLGIGSALRRAQIERMQEVPVNLSKNHPGIANPAMWNRVYATPPRLTRR